jgi:3-oxoadipate enol-lactonase
VAGFEPDELTVERRDGRRLLGEAIGEGPPIVLLHGLTATRHYVVHHSKLLARRGHRQLSYDARGHGSSDPATEGGGYGYGELLADLEAVVESELGIRRFALAGHSMGAHTAVAYTLENPDRLAALILISPVYTGPPDDDTLARWDRLAEGLEGGGVDGFLAALDRDLDPAWRETVLRFTRRRMLEHRHPAAVARALREAPRSRPFEDLAELEFANVPALVVASRDVADPGHPHAVAAAYAERLPDAHLVSEGEGESPLPWQGGKLAREIASFCSARRVRERFER